MCAGHSFRASTMVQWYRAPSSFRLVISCLHPYRYAPSIRSYFRCIFFAHPCRRCACSQTANVRASRLRRCRLLRFLLAGRFPLRSLVRPPSHSPSSCTPRARPVPCAPLALVVLLPLLRVLCLRCRPEALKRQHPGVASLLFPRSILTSSSRICHARAIDYDEQAHLPRFSVRAPRRRRRPVAATPIGAQARVFRPRPFPHATGTRA
jgi:hypothetical protein